MANQKELIEKMYGSNLESTKQQLTQNYNANVSALDQQKADNAKTTQQKLNRTAVEAERNRKNYAEMQNANGLSSGAMAQARLAQDNQLQSDMATIRAAQQTADQGIAMEKNLLAQQFQSAISKAQADNDLQKAQQLYKLAQQEDEKLLQKQTQAANTMAAVGDYSLYGKLYGLTDDQTAALTNQYQKEQNKETEALERQKQAAAAEAMASVGDYSLFGQLYGLTPEQVNALNSQYQKDVSAQTQMQELAKQEAAAKLMAAAGDFSLYGQLYGLAPQQIAALESAYRAENATTSGSGSNYGSSSDYSGDTEYQYELVTPPAAPEVTPVDTSLVMDSQKSAAEKVKDLNYAMQTGQITPNEYLKKWSEVNAQNERQKAEESAASVNYAKDIPALLANGMSKGELIRLLNQDMGSGLITTDEYRKYWSMVNNY